MQTVREMIPEYKRNLDRLRQRRLDLLREREFEPSFEKRYKLTERIVRPLWPTGALLALLLALYCCELILRRIFKLV